MKKLVLAFLIICLASTTALAKDFDINFSTDVTANQFEELTKQAGMLLAYRSLAPAEPLGITGFDVGVAVTGMEVDGGVWSEFLNNGDVDVPDYIGAPRIIVRKGLPFNIDVGASYAKLPDSNVEIIGAEVQYALLEGTIATPALAVRGGYTTLEGVKDLDLEVMSADVLVSKGLTMFTPYAGVGYVKTEASYQGDDVNLKALLPDQDVDGYRYYAGVKGSLLLLDLTAEAEMNSEEQLMISVKAGISW